MPGLHFKSFVSRFKQAVKGKPRISQIVSAQDYILISGAGDATVNGYYRKGSDGVWRLSNGAYITLSGTSLVLFSIAGDELYDGDITAMNAIWVNAGAAIDPPPFGKFVQSKLEQE